MRTKHVALSAVVVFLGVAGGLLTVGGTWALWNASAPSGAGTVKAADFRVELNGSPMTVGGVSATIALTDPATPLTPGQPAYAAVTVANLTNASAPFPIQVTLGQPRITSASTPALAVETNLTVRSVFTAGECPAAQYTATPTSATVTKGATARACLRFDLATSASSALSNSSATIAVPVTATQLP